MQLYARAAIPSTFYWSALRCDACTQYRACCLIAYLEVFSPNLGQKLQELDHDVDQTMTQLQVLLVHRCSKNTTETPFVKLSGAAGWQTVQHTDRAHLPAPAWCHSQMLVGTGSGIHCRAVCLQNCVVHGSPAAHAEPRPLRQQLQPKPSPSR